MGRVADGWRKRAPFRAGIELGRIIQGIQDKRMVWATLSSRAEGRVFMDRAMFVAERPGVMASPEGASDHVTGITRQRLKLNDDFPTMDPMEFGWLKMGQDSGVLSAFPAQEFRRIESHQVPRDDWAVCKAVAVRRLGPIVGLGPRPVSASGSERSR